MDARGATKIVADSYDLPCHAPWVLSSSEALARLKALRDSGVTTNAAVQRLLGLPSSRVAEIFGNRRGLKADEVAILASHFEWADKPKALLAESPRDEPSMVQIQHIDLAFGLGSTFTDSPVEIEVLDFPKQWVETITYSPPALLTWARGKGDSMRPTIDDGDLVLLDRSQRDVREQDALWAITVGDTGSIKRLRKKGDRFQIFSDNPAVPMDEEPIDFVNVVARVIFVGRRT